jgi:hypothetical protein
VGQTSNTALAQWARNRHKALAHWACNFNSRLVVYHRVVHQVKLPDMFTFVHTVAIGRFTKPVT